MDEEHKGNPPMTIMDATVPDMISDLVQAKKAVLWDIRAEGLRPQLQARGLNMEQLEILLLKLAAEVHENRTDTRAGAVILEEGGVTMLAQALSFSRQFLSDRHGDQGAKFQKDLEVQLQALYQHKNLQ